MALPYERGAPIHEDDDCQSCIVSSLFSAELTFQANGWMYSTCFVAIGSVLNAVYLANLNKQKVSRRQELLAPYQDLPDGEEKAWVELGDKHPDFHYKL